MLKNHKDVIIIGAGVSGMTSAIYLKRFNLDVLLIESKYPGGQMTKTDIIKLSFRMIIWKRVRETYGWKKEKINIKL